MTKKKKKVKKKVKKPPTLEPTSTKKRVKKKVKKVFKNKAPEKSPPAKKEPTTGDKIRAEENQLAADEKVQSLARARRQPITFNAQHLYRLLVQIVGRRQSAFSLLEELRERRVKLPAEELSQRQRVFEIYLEQYMAICETEKKLTSFAVELYPNFQLPHGAGYYSPPPVITFEHIDGTYYREDHEGQYG